MPALMFNSPPTLADALVRPRAKAYPVLTDAMLVVFFSGFVALSAHIAIPLPFTVVPLTGQTLGVLVTGAILGSRRAGLAVLLYLLEGALGLPVFSPSATLGPGLARLMGPTGGYLFAFPLAAAVVGLLAERGWDRQVPRVVLAMLIGNLVIYTIAIPWLALFTGNIGLAVATGMVPFIPGDIIKLVVAVIGLPASWALVHRTQRSIRHKQDNFSD